LREVGLTSIEELKESITKLSCSIQKLQDRICRQDTDSTELVRNNNNYYYCYCYNNKLYYYYYYYYYYAKLFCSETAGQDLP